MRLLVGRNSIQEIAARLKKIDYIVLQWKLINVVPFYIPKTETTLSSRVNIKHVWEEITNKKPVFREKEMKLNNIATNWVRIKRLDSSLIFVRHIRKKLKKILVADVKIRYLTRMQKHLPKLVSKIGIAVVQGIEFFRSKIYCHIINP